MRRKIYLLAVCCTFLLSCCTSSSQKNEKINYSTSSDSAIFYYQKGWQQIMDYGEYGKAEHTYRKALSFDQDFIVGQSVLARLTRNLSERQKIYNELLKNRDKISGDERLILDVYIALTHYTNLRDESSPYTSSALQEAFKIGERNLGRIVEKYPKEVYLKAEYIEVLHANYGPKQALDSLNAIILPSQLDNPFLLGYKATMQGELADYENALKNALKLNQLLKGKQIPKGAVTLADIYFKMHDLKNAKKYIDEAINIDSLNLDASRLKAKIDDAITK